MSVQPAYLYGDHSSSGLFHSPVTVWLCCGALGVLAASQSDVGGQFLLEDNWTTYRKARLNCSLSGDYPFYFDELQSTHYDPQRALIYAVFTTPRSRWIFDLDSITMRKFQLINSYLSNPSFTIVNTWSWYRPRLLTRYNPPTIGIVFLPQ